MVSDQYQTLCLVVRLMMLRSMWHELRVVLHNRENTLLTLAVQAFAREEQEFSESVANNWVSLVDAVENMPCE
jgi:sorting nexin-8